MRPIDGDALMKVVKQHHDFFSGAMVDSDKARRDELHQVMADIVNAPAIDAIPVEWLESKECEMLEREDKFNYRRADSIRLVILMWQKEQEAR